MKKLTSFQAKYLRGLAHAYKPVVFVGQKGLTDALIKSAGEAFQRHELIKVKFIDFKEKEQKLEIAAVLEKKNRQSDGGYDRTYCDLLQTAQRSRKTQDSLTAI